MLHCGQNDCFVRFELLGGILECPAVLLDCRQNDSFVRFELLGGTLEYTYAQRTDDSTLDYYLELTDDLTGNTWTNDGYSVVATNVTGGTFDYVTNHISTLDKDEKFIKLIIERP